MLCSFQRPYSIVVPACIGKTPENSISPGINGNPSDWQRWKTLIFFETGKKSKYSTNP